MWFAQVVSLYGTRDVTSYSIGQSGDEMKKLMLGVCFAIFALGISWQIKAADLDVTTQVNAVEVYRRGATVIRQGGIDVSQGEHRLQFNDLPGDISVDALQIAVDGELIEVGQVRTEIQQRSRAYDAQVADLEDRINTKRMEIRTVEDSTATANLQLKFLEGIAQGYAKESWFEGARGEADISSWRSALSVLQDGSEAARRTVRTNQVTLRQHQMELSRLEREMNALRGKAPRALFAEITVYSAKPQRLSVQLTYRQFNAGWTPRYEARVDTEAQRVRLLRKAQVVQGTAEDWTDVALSLASSEPSHELVPPEVNSLLLDLINPQVKRRSMLQSSVAMEEVVVTAQRQNFVDDSFADDATRVEVSNYGVTYEIPGRVSVTNDRSDDQSFELDELQTELDFISRVYPGHSSTAFLVGRFTYAGEAPLSASDMAVYLDNTFVGKSFMPGALPQAEITLPLGQDRRLDVRLQDLAGSVGEGGVISRRNEKVTSKLFEITNRRSQSALVEVIDRVPVAVHEDIDVEIPRQATPPTESDWEDEPGVVMWRKNLAAGETWHIKHQYEVSYPAKMILNEN